MKNKGIIIGIVLILLLVLGFFLYPNNNSNNTQNNNKSSSKVNKKSKDNKKDISIDDVIKVGLYETVSINDLEIELLSVDDSRCPVGVNCYWEGELEYSLDVNGKSIKLGTVQKKEEEYGNYKIMLNENNDSTQYVLLEIKEK